ncbi:glycerophosphodiesterase [Yersinia phage YerA41]|nr:glycerophosphodiesterase [Yersinia phage YerA41]
MLSFTAHRGLFDSNFDIAENTEASIKLALTLNMDIEIDVRMTKDGELVLNHNPDIFGLMIHKTKYSVLKKYYPRLYKFSDCIELLSNNQFKNRLFVEVKSFDDKFIRDKEVLVKVYGILKDTKIDYLMTSMNPKLLIEYDKITSSSIDLGIISYGFGNYRGQLPNRLCDQLSVMSILNTHPGLVNNIIYSKSLSSESIEKYKDLGYKIYLWTYRAADIDQIDYDKLRLIDGITVEPSLFSNSLQVGNLQSEFDEFKSLISENLCPVSYDKVE